MLTDTRKSKYCDMYETESGKCVWTGGFWKDAVDSCARSMVPQLNHMFDSKEISHVVENFKICAGRVEGDFDGTVFGDGDFYKWMESELYAGVVTGETERFDKLEEYIELIAAAQQPDGYLSTKQIIESAKGKGLGRMGDINEFEVYNMGHMFTSACLHKRVTGSDSFLNIAKGCADYLEKMYDEAEKAGNVQTAVCPSHYMGLIELYRVTEDEKYLNLADKAIKLRDSVKNGLDDNQDRIPLKEHEKIIGHAVRATYLYAGVADLYMETGDKDYLKVLRSVWNNMMTTKIYITGGIGALYNGTSPYGNFFVDQKIHQAFGYEYQLPNITAYCETCASIGLVMWAYRMFLIDHKSEYIDCLERVMLNVNLAGVSLDGKRYFYENMLRRAKKLEYELIWPLTRTEYILSYCCPPNLARAIMQSSEYAYTCTKDTVYTCMYGENKSEIVLDSGAAFVINQKTEYPYDGKITFTFTDVKCDGPIKLALRIPGWAKEAALTVNGVESVISERDASGYVTVSLDSVIDSTVELNLSMPVRYTVAHNMVEETTGQLAIERGPLVYCIESADLTDGTVDTLDDLYIDPKLTFTPGSTVIEGRKIGTLTGKAVKVTREGYDRDALYQELIIPDKETVDIQMIPYFAWDNRGMGEMRVYMQYLI